MASRDDICSLEVFDAERALQTTREHWTIENRLHGQLDVAFREGECRVCAENLIAVRHIASNPLHSVKRDARRHPGPAWPSSLE